MIVWSKFYSWLERCWKFSPKSSDHNFTPSTIAVEQSKIEASSTSNTSSYLAGDLKFLKFMQSIDSDRDRYNRIRELEENLMNALERIEKNNFEGTKVDEKICRSCRKKLDDDKLEHDGIQPSTDSKNEIKSGHRWFLVRVDKDGINESQINVIGDLLDVPKN